MIPLTQRVVRLLQVRERMHVILLLWEQMSCGRGMVGALDVPLGVTVQERFCTYKLIVLGQLQCMYARCMKVADEQVNKGQLHITMRE